MMVLWGQYILMESMNSRTQSIYTHSLKYNNVYQTSYDVEAIDNAKMKLILTN